MGMDVTPYPNLPGTMVSVDIHGFMLYEHQQHFNSSSNF
jgi:hypothetical protein